VEVRGTCQCHPIHPSMHLLAKCQHYNMHYNNATENAKWSTEQKRVNLDLLNTASGDLMIKSPVSHVHILITYSGVVIEARLWF